MLLVNSGELNLSTVEHFLIFLSGTGIGATLVGLLGHMVQTFPTPKNIYGAWFLGSLQYIVGQRYRAANTIEGNQTLTLTVPGTSPAAADNKP